MNPPAPLTGNSPLVRWLNALRAAVLASQVHSVSGGSFERGAQGTHIKVRPGHGGSTPTGSGMHFRGEYDSGVDYIAGDVVVIRTGTNAGSYVCVKDHPSATYPPTQPDTGIYWVSLSNGNTVGQWL